jgi:hypothetical protein
VGTVSVEKDYIHIEKEKQKAKSKQSISLIAHLLGQKAKKKICRKFGGTGNCRHVRNVSGPPKCD